MASHEGHHETAGRHDLESAPSRVIERLPHQRRGEALAFVGRRHLRVGEDQAVALLVIDRDRKPMLGRQLVAMRRRIVGHLGHALLDHWRLTSQNIG